MTNKGVGAAIIGALSGVFSKYLCVKSNYEYIGNRYTQHFRSQFRDFLILFLCISLSLLCPFSSSSYFFRSFSFAHNFLYTFPCLFRLVSFSLFSRIFIMENIKEGNAQIMYAIVTIQKKKKIERVENEIKEHFFNYMALFCTYKTYAMSVALAIFSFLLFVFFPFSLAVFESS